MTLRRPGHRRAQSMVLFTLTMFLLVLMVLLTIGMGLRIRDRMETQHIADLTAYTNALATARAFNAIALMRRAQTGELVALVGVESIISWTSMVRAGLAASGMGLSGCANAQQIVQQILQRDAQMGQMWDQLDAAAGIEAYNIQILGGYLEAMQGQLTYSVDQAGNVTNGQLATRISGMPGSYADLVTRMAEGPSLARSGLSAVPQNTGTDVGIRELINATSGGASYGLANAMGSRGYTFITHRQSGPQAGLNGALAGVLGGGQVTFAGGSGSAYWGPSRGHGGPPINADYTWAEDHGPITINVPGCPPVTIQGWAFVKSTDFTDMTDDHQWWPAGQDPAGERSFRHTLGPCLPPACPVTFISGMNYRVGDFNNDPDVFAQPKNFAVIQRNYANRPRQPWELFFNYSFTPQGGKVFDNRGLVTADGTDISLQTAISTGIAYYHRRGYWQEAPSLWNPFWRATLVSADIDTQGDLRKGGNDVPMTLNNARAGWAAAAYQALVQNGFQGTH